MRMTISALALIVCTGPLGAQNIPWTKSASLGGADFALARGFATIEWNPANIFLEEINGITMGAAIHGGRLLVDGASAFDLADIIRAAGSGNSSLLDAVPEDGLKIDAFSESNTATRLARALDLPDPAANTNVPSFGFSYRNVGFVFRRQTVLSAEISRELVDLAVNGFNPERIDEYAARQTSMRSFTFSTVTLAFSKDLGPLSAGLGVRYLAGRRLMFGQVFEPEVDVDAEELTAAAASVESRGGRGAGVDLGITYRIGSKGFASLAVQNVWQRMFWNEELFAAQAEFDQNDLGGSDVRNLIGRFNAVAFDPGAATLEAYQAANGLFTESFLPRVLRVGMGWRFDAATNVQVMASKRMGAGLLVPASMTRVGAGVERQLGPLALRLGAALEEEGGRELTGGLGLGLGFIELQFSGGYTDGRGSQAGVLHGYSGSVGLSVAFENWIES